MYELLEQRRRVDEYVVEALIDEDASLVQALSACRAAGQRADSRLDSTALQTVGSRGWDGFAVALVR